MANKIQMELQRFHEFVDTDDILVISCTLDGVALPILPTSNTTWSPNAALYVVEGGTPANGVITYANSSPAFIGPTFEIRGDLFGNTNFANLAFTTTYTSNTINKSSTRHMLIERTDTPPINKQSYVDSGRQPEVEFFRKKYMPIIIDDTV
jgi:hypothetical protein